MASATMAASDAASSSPRRRIRRRDNFVVPHLDTGELNERRRQTERRLRLNQSLAWSCWRWLLGIAACCELLAYRFPMEPSCVEPNQAPHQHWWSLFRRREEEEPTLEDAVEAIVSPELILLYIMYFLDAFVHAQEMKSRAFRANEKKRLLQKGNKHIYWDPAFTFGITLLFYLSILPTWFWWELGTHLGITGVFGTDLVREAATEYAQYSLGYSIIVYTFKHTSASVKSELKTNLKSYIKSLLPRLSKYAIRHPRQFKRRSKKGYTAIIWLKYLIPIAAHVNNSGIFGKLNDVWKQVQQRLRERKEKKLRKKLWIRLDSSTKREVAAVVIQRNYRSYCSRKWTRLLKLEQEKRETQMILLVQNAIKKREKEEMEEQEQAISELARIQQRERARQRNPQMKSVFNPLLSLKCATATDDDDLKRKYQLEAEVQDRIKTEKNKLMLLRPDSRFVFYCQSIYVLCGIIETAHLVLRPRLRDESRTDPQTEFLRFVFDYSHIVIHCILCFGVFVWFFVGEFDPVTGRLVQQRFFSRYIYPGLLLHIVVNPALYEIKQIVKFILRAGPGRSWRWWILFLFPFWRRLHAWWEWRIWMDLVQRENQRLLAGPAKQSTVGRRQSCFR